MTPASAFILPEGNVQISFSGGRTSAYMLYQILAVNGRIDPNRVQVVFCNTGREMPATLDFVRECGDRWGVNIVWIERRDHENPRQRFETVSHSSASRNGEPFEALIRRRKYLPNQQSRFCTSELKVRPAKEYLVSLGWDNWQSAIGIRADEQRRINRNPTKERWQRWYPLADAKVTRHDVVDFWRGQPFDLGLGVVNGNSALGNCDGCFLKSEAHQAMLARDFPERHVWWEEMEQLAGSLTSNPNGARFRASYTKKELRDFVERQGDWIFDDEDALCQADGGECME